MNIFLFGLIVWSVLGVQFHYASDKSYWPGWWKWVFFAVSGPLVCAVISAFWLKDWLTVKSK